MYYKELSNNISNGHKITEKVKTEFGGMSHDELNYKLNPASWSIGQCLDHLIVSNSTYFSMLDELTTGRYKMNLWQKANPFSKIIGKKLVQTQGPEVVKKFKSPKPFLPVQSDVNPNIVSDFEAHQEYFLKQLQQTSTLWHKKVVVSSPVSPLITYSVHDMIRILMGHEERHFNQALKVKEHPRFNT